MSDSIRLLLGSAVLALVAALTVAALTLYGVVSMEGARIVLGLAWIIAVVGVGASEFLSKSQTVNKVAMTTGVAIVLAFGFWQLDAWVMRQKQSRRHVFSSDERTRFEKPLMGQKSLREEIQLACPQADENTCIYAGQFVNLFRETGWVVQGNSVQRIALSTPRAGVILYRRGTGALDPNDWRSGLWARISPSVENVRQAFVNVGIEPKSGANPDLPEGVITVYFGLERPNEAARTQLTETMEQVERERRQGHIPPRPQ